MAIDKSRTSPTMKALIIGLAATFVLGVGFAGISSLSSCSVAAPLLPGGASSVTSPAASTETSQSISLKWTPQIQAREASLTAEPKNYDLLVAQADAYFGWAYDMQQLTPSESTTSNPLWGSARTFFARAVAIKATDAGTVGDYAITLFYTGDTAGAITEGEKARALDPKLAQNLFNLGNYYATAGDKAKAIDAYNAYLAADPTGNLVQTAKDNIAALSK
jgi:tetratricopeptide (TPR) repeat protein